jgi:lipoprotein-anchoring transpeptidase ErfK/SrfK
MIYIHGTNQEQFVGASPSSRGCIRMKTRDVVALFELVRGTPAWVVIH